MTDTKGRLEGRVAVVAGATRGAGRGIARALGEAGAVVYCTGRSVAGNPSPYARAETIEETAELVSAAGGTGIAVRVDHTREEEVRELFARVERDRGRLDLLADSVAGESAVLGGMSPLWKTDLSHAPAALEQALLSHVITAKHAAALMVPRKRGLIVEVTEGDILFGGGNAVGVLVKSGLKMLALHLADELHTHRVAAVAITPGFLRSESMLERFGVTEANWRDGGSKDEHFLHSESPLFVGRAVAALAADPDVLARSGLVLSSWELARAYGFTDANGERPDWGRHFAESVVPRPAFAWVRATIERNATWFDTMADRTRAYLAAAE